jgi:FMN phosphatase YigB (HAD superfamily)
MHLVSDFDGVWTDPRAEADAIRDLMIERLAEAANLSYENVAIVFAEIQKNFNENPFEYGWEFEGSITAFPDEDMYGRNHAIAMCLWDARPAFPESMILREAIVKIATNAEKFADMCFRDGRSRFREKNKSFLVPQAAQVISELRQRGFKMTIVSNSKVTHILDLFDAAEVSLDGFEVIGGARKFHLGLAPSVPESWQWQEAKISLQRPHYLDLLERLKPDAVIGDVFSLDLSLPLYLRSSRSDWKHLRAGLIKQPYTPNWVVNENTTEIATQQGLDLLPSLADVPSWLEQI